ncbi:MAG TPA: CHRD domain-containing protein [Bryobacteraceae bacterium]|nr:CHRD domain-containing protein [Bryobacteraceae bacterium]
MKISARAFISAASALFVLTTCAPAATITYTAILKGSNEAPPVASTATGFATLTLNGDMLSVMETFSGLIGGPASAAHIHCCALPGSNASVAVPFPSFPNATSGTFTGSFDLTDPAVYSTAFLTAQGGTAAGAEAALIAGFNSNMAYANIHDAMFPGGEIRGFITIVPEPGSFSLAGILLTIAALTGIRRKKASIA